VAGGGGAAGPAGAAALDRNERGWRLKDIEIAGAWVPARLAAYDLDGMLDGRPCRGERRRRAAAAPG
jgi:hypothetical protein